MYAIRILLKSLVLPPANLFLIALLGGLCLRRWPRLGRRLIGGSLVGLYLLCTPVVGRVLLRTLEREAPVPEGATAQAIVILSGDSSEMPEFGGQTVGESSLERIRYGAFLHRSTEAPILVTGGTHRSGSAPVAALMRDALETEFGVPVRWVEGKSWNTWQNARNSAEILRREGIRRVFLVTHAWHMPRSRWCFEAFGFDVVPAPTAFLEPLDLKPGILLPSVNGLQNSANAFHEWIGLLFYSLVHRGSPAA